MDDKPSIKMFATTAYYCWYEWYNTERLRIDSGGNVGIGTDNSTSSSAAGSLPLFNKQSCNTDGFTDN